MLKRKNIKDRGKIRFTTFFQKLQPGDKVSLVRELSVQADFPKRMQGRTGTVVQKRGSAYVVEVKDLNLMKQFSIKPIHLKKVLNK